MKTDSIHVRNSSASRVPGIPAGVLALAAILLLSSGCATFREQPSVGTLINLTPYELEVQKNGEFVAVLGRGETHNIYPGRSREVRPADTVLVLAHQGGDFIGSAYTTFRQRGFRVWEVTSDILRRPEGE